MANRVQEIQNSISVEQWNHVESKQNPADEASRGVKSQELLHSRRINGPAFLWKTEDQWPINQDHSEGTFDLQNNDPEVKKHVTMATTQIDSEKTSLCEGVRYFSDWYRAKRAIALVTHYVRSLRARVQKKHCKEELTREVKVTELESAERAIIRAVQTSAFKDELDVLKQIKRKNPDPNSRVFAQQRKSNIKTYSSLYKLDPFVDDDGILRVGGRLRRASLSDDMKFPIILPRNSHVTTLIVRYFHERTSHQGKTMTLNEVRSNGFWIISGSVVVSSIISSCVKCKKLCGAVPPFTYGAVDYFGPFIVKDGRKELKRHGVLFTCMASRAIHLETSNSLDTDSFINALRRFISQRGPIRQLRSDQGTYFVGARKQLAQALGEIDQERIKAKLLEEQCDWFCFKMNVPATSHMGGVWERQIRTVRSVLSSLLNNNRRQLDDESLRTLMCEAEAIVNSRPLTVTQISDPDSPSPLTQNHLLKMKSKVVLAPPGAMKTYIAGSVGGESNI